MLAGTNAKNSDDLFDNTLYCVCPGDVSCTGGTSCAGTEINVNRAARDVSVCDKDGGTCECPAAALPCAKYPGKLPVLHARLLKC